MRTLHQLQADGIFIQKEGVGRRAKRLNTVWNGLFSVIYVCTSGGEGLCFLFCLW